MNETQGMSDFLVIQAARFGDLVQTKRLILTLMARGSVRLLVDRAMTRLASLLYPDAEAYGFPFHTKPTADDIADMRAFLKKCTPQTITSVYNCNFSEMTAAVCRHFDIEQVVGYRPAASFSGGIERSPWTRLIFSMTRERCSSPLNLVDFWGGFASRPMEASSVNPTAKGGGGGLGIVMAGREARRSLPAQLLAGIVKIYFSLLDGPQVYLLGSRTEQRAAVELLRFLPSSILSHVHNLTGKTDWDGLFHAVRGLDAVITPDTGTMHLAAHLGVPVKAFFLSSAWCHETGPYGSGHTVWQAAPDCAPCLESAPCSNEMACLKLLQGNNFLRSVALAEDPGHSLGGCPVPEGMQLWKSGFDALGGVFSLIAGQDASAEERAVNRELIADQVFLSGNVARSGKYDGDMAVRRHAYGKSIEDLNWMLPIRRYS